MQETSDLPVYQFQFIFVSGSIVAGAGFPWWAILLLVVVPILFLLCCFCCIFVFVWWWIRLRHRDSYPGTLFGQLIDFECDNQICME